MPLLQNSASYAQCQEQVMALASNLWKLGNVPMVKAQMELILEVHRPLTRCAIIAP